MALGSVNSRIVSVVFAVLLFGVLACKANLDCSEPYKEGDYSFNLTKLQNRNATFSKQDVTPPSVTTYTNYISPCGPLSGLVGVDENEQCQYNVTRACRIVNITRSDKNQSLVSQVIQIASNDENLKYGIKMGPIPTGSDDSNGPSLMVTLNGGQYNGKPQTLKIVFNCDRSLKEDNYVANYTEGVTEGVLDFTWNTPDVCGDKEQEPKTPMGNFTKFLLYVFLIGLVYLGIGASYNYRVYGSTGWDLLPNRDFWRDFPYLVSDLVRTVYLSMRTGGRAGYHSV